MLRIAGKGGSYPWNIGTAAVKKLICCSINKIWCIVLRYIYVIGGVRIKYIEDADIIGPVYSACGNNSNTEWIFSDFISWKSDAPIWRTSLTAMCVCKICAEGRRYLYPPGTWRWGYFQKSFAGNRNCQLCKERCCPRGLRVHCLLCNLCALRA